MTESQTTENPLAMVVMAHPDDADFLCSGTAVRWIADGWDVMYVICTDGSGGGSDDATDVGQQAREDLSAMRQAEQRAVGEFLGLKDVIFLEHPDGRLDATLSFRRELVRLFRTFRPSRVICPTPDRVWTRPYNLPRYHADHLACGEACLAALYPASQNPWDFPELMGQGLTPHKVSEFYIVGAPVINHVVDVSDLVETKVEALLCHRSQLGDDTPEKRQLIRDVLASQTAEDGYDFAEAYCLVVNE